MSEQIFDGLVVPQTRVGIRAHQVGGTTAVIVGLFIMAGSAYVRRTTLGEEFDRLYPYVDRAINFSTRFGDRIGRARNAIALQLR